MYGRPDRQRYWFRDDFDAAVDFTYAWTTTAPDSGSATAQDQDNGVLVLSPSDGTVADNDEIYVASALQTNSFERGFYASAMLRFDELVQDRANVIFGLMSSVGANALIDNGGGVRTSGQCAVFYKVDGRRTWECQTRDAFSYENTTTNIQPDAPVVEKIVDGQSITTNQPWTLLEIEGVDPNPAIAVAGRILEVTFKVNGVKVALHRVSTRDRAQLALMAGVKNGSANHETLDVDWLYAEQERRRY